MLIAGSEGKTQAGSPSKNTLSARGLLDRDRNEPALSRVGLGSGSSGAAKRAFRIIPKLTRRAVFGTQPSGDTEPLADHALWCPRANSHTALRVGSWQRRAGEESARRRDPPGRINATC